MKVPQINEETGISADYWNEYFTKRCSFSFESNPCEAVAKQTNIYPIKKYEERFPILKFEDVITDKNRNRVKRLDELADLVNSKFTDASQFTEDDFKQLINEVFHLIWNKENEKSTYPEVNRYV